MLDAITKELAHGEGTAGLTADTVDLFTNPAFLKACKLVCVCVCACVCVYVCMRVGVWVCVAVADV